MSANVYYSPEKFGLEIVAHGEDPQACYSYDDVIVWRHGDRLVWATDSGCSCPTPFEGLGVDDLTPLDIDEFERFVDDEWLSHQSDPDTLMEKFELKSKVRKIAEAAS